MDVKKEALAPWFTSLGEENNGLKFRIYDHEGLEVDFRLPIDGKFVSTLSRCFGIRVKRI